MSKTAWLLFLFIGGIWLYGLRIGQLDVYSLDEARNAGCAREMWEKGDYIVPTFNYQLREQKPPLHYYFMALGYSLFGFGAWAARFFSVLAGVATLISTYLFAARYLGEVVARWASVVLLVSTHFSIQIHMAVPDPYLIFFNTVGTWGLFVGFIEKRPGYLWAAYIAIGLGSLCKGPIGIVMPGLGVFLYLIASGRFTWSNILRFQPFIGLGLMLLIALPWYFAVHYATKGAWTQAFFFTQNLERFGTAMEGHGGIFLLTWAYVFLGLLPFGVYLWPALVKAWRDRLAHQEVIGFCLWAGTAILFIFSVSSTKLPNYTVPLYPFWAVILGYYIAHFECKPGNVVMRWLAVGFYAFLSLALPVGLYLALAFDKTLSHQAYLALSFLFLPLGGGLALWYMYQQNFRVVCIIQATSFALLTLVFFGFAFPYVDKENPVFVARQKIDLKKPLFAYQAFNPAFVFYAQKEIPVLGNISELRQALAKHPEAYVISREDRLDSLSQVKELKLILKRKDIFEIPTTILLQKTEAKPTD
ncbi:MAG: glycosyltransferase family 39 protein [Microscillaceae bacterium]